MHDHCPGGPEPGLEGGDSGEVVSLAHHDVGTGLEQMLLHVVPEVIQEFHLLLQGRRRVPEGVVVLHALKVDVVNVTGKSKENTDKE